jgi:hypothetical protein
MHILLFILYSLLCGYGILKIPFFQKSGIRPGLLIALFALHLLVGCLHNIIAWRYYPEHGDIWRLFAFSLSDRHLLMTHQYSQLLADNSRWTYFSHNSVTFILMILNFFSFDNLYIDTLLFAFPVFLGATALYRVFRRRFPADPLTAVTVFLLPSTLFWTACIHREAVLYMALGFFFYGLDRRKFLFTIFLFLLIIYFRPVVAALLIPALLASWWTEKPLPRRRAWILAGACAGILTILLLTPGLSAWPINLLSRSQAEFRDLEGHSRLYLPMLDGSWNSLLRAFPSAVLNGLFEPLPGSGGQKIYLAFSIELILIWIVALAAVILHSTHPLKPRTSAPPPLPTLAFSRCCILFALLGMLLVGLIVPFAGAIVRYRSIYLPFLLAPFLHSLAHWPPLRRLNEHLATWLPNPALSPGPDPNTSPDPASIS